MSLTRIETRSRAVSFDGQSFGHSGPYERIEGLAHFAIDPADTANSQIVDLSLAERGADGLVHFDADFRILQAIDPARRSGRLLFDILNRGGMPALGFFNNTVPPLAPTDLIPVGNGHLFRHGWTVAWCGWQWDVPRGTPGLLGLTAPQAVENGRPIPGPVCVQIVRNSPAASVRLCDVLGATMFVPYFAADVDEPGARMTVQDWPDGPRTDIPRGRWRFALEENGQLTADDANVWLEGGFEPGKVYDIFYTTRICPVVGCGLLSARDFASFLRYGSSEEGNPCAGTLKRAHTFGVSQSGRFLRTFLYHGLNVDEAGRRVFDGVNPHVAGGRRGEFNHRHAQPSVEVTPGFGHLPPHSDEGLLARQRAAGAMPKVMYTNSSAEYWRGDAALSHIRPEGADIELDGAVRSYLLAGTQHGVGVWPLAWMSPLPEGPRVGNWMNAVDQRPLMRAALANLDAWSADGGEPPPSAVPHAAEGTAIPRAEANAAFAAVPGATMANAARMRFIQHMELGPRANEGIGQWPAEIGEAYPALVSALDADRNELAGVRAMELRVPLATYTGWNPRHPSIGASDQLARYVGSTFPFAATKVEREQTGDPRPSIAERYSARASYESAVRAAAKDLLAERWLLEEDVPGVIKAALAKYDAFLAGVASVPA